jgi:hypothetical protein
MRPIVKLGNNCRKALVTSEAGRLPRENGLCLGDFIGLGPEVGPSPFC